MSTPFSQDNAAFTDRAHMAARDHLYPSLFPQSRIEYDRVTSVKTNNRHAILDGELAIDVVLHVDMQLPKPMQFTVQERFRKTQYQKFADLTITEWNHATGLPSELHKLASDLFVYGYYDERMHALTEALVIYSAPLKRALVSKQIMFERRLNTRSNQSFITISFDALHEAGVVALHYKMNPVMQKEVVK